MEGSLRRHFDNHCFWYRHKTYQGQTFLINTFIKSMNISVTHISLKMCSVKWNKLDRERQILYEIVLICTILKLKKNSEKEMRLLVVTKGRSRGRGAEGHAGKGWVTAQEDVTQWEAKTPGSGWPQSEPPGSVATLDQLPPHWYGTSHWLPWVSSIAISEQKEIPKKGIFL